MPAMNLSFGSILGFIEGPISLVVLCVLAGIEKISRTSSLDDPAETERALHDLWSLDVSDQNVAHNFLRLPDGLQLHYLTSSKAVARKDLIVFLHGFPDSCYLWVQMLESTLSEHANLVSLDLPGYGGSDGLPNYGPDHMLTTVESAIKQLKQQYDLENPTEQEKGQCIVVGHDWGGVIASRIAAGTQNLVDHLVMINTLFPSHAIASIRMRLTRAQNLLTERPDGFLCLAREEFSCVLSQLMKSHYIFTFNLPFFSATLFPFVIRYVLKYCHRMADAESTRAPGYSLAASLGPSVTQCKDYRDRLPYSGSVFIRARDQPYSLWDERIRLYHEGLATLPWRRPMQDTPGAFEVRDESKIRCSTTVIFGTKDQALDTRLNVDGIERFIDPTSGPRGHVILLEDVGHWSPLNKSCISILLKTLHGQIRADRLDRTQSVFNTDALESSNRKGNVQIRQLL